MKIVDSNKCGTLNASILERFENLIGGGLPSDYRDYQLINNGGLPLYRGLKLSDQVGWTSVEYLSGLHDQKLSEHPTLISLYEADSEALPAEMISIGGDGSGITFCYFIKGTKRGCVYAIEPSAMQEMTENEAKRENLTSDGIYYLADSFTNFLEILEKEPD